MSSSFPIRVPKFRWKDILVKVTEPTPDYVPNRHHGFRLYKYDSVDVFNNDVEFEMENNLDNSFDENKERDNEPSNVQGPVSRFSRLRHKWFGVVWFYIFMEQTWFFLTVLGFIVAMLFLTTDYMINLIIQGRNRLMEKFDDALGFFPCVIWVLYSLICCLIARFCVQYISPFSAGSGIPEMKSILWGLKLKHYLSFQALLAKVVGVVCVYASDLSVGREGPYITIAALVANNLTKFPFFNRIRKDKSLKFQVMSAACAAGIATVFGAPVGGVLFSIEVTSTYYLIQNLTKSFLCAVSSAFFVNYVDDRGLVALFVTNFETKPFYNVEIVSFVLMGATFGVVGAFFIYAQDLVTKARKEYKILAQDRYGQLIVISIISSLVTYISFVPLRGGQLSVISYMFQETPIESWSHPSLFFNLTSFIVIKFFLTVVSIGLSVPCGLFVPIFVIGSVMGRLWGEVMVGLFPSLAILPGGYAVVGAAAFSAGCTRALSATVIIFELTGQLNHMLPVLIAVIVSTAVGNLFGPSIYDKILQGKGLPYLPPLTAERAYRKTVSDVMESIIHFVPTNATYVQINNLLASTSFSFYPVVDTADNMIMMGEVYRGYLETVLEKREREYQRLIKQSGLSLTSKGYSPNTSFANIPPYDSSNNNSSNNLLEVIEGVPPPNRRISLSNSGNIIHSSVPDREEFFGAVATLQLKRPQYDPCPFQVVDKTSLVKMHFMFSMLGITHSWCTSSGRLVGVITKKEFMKKCWELTQKN